MSKAEERKVPIELNPCMTCGHDKRLHIYEEGACRPGFICGDSCEKFESGSTKQNVPRDFWLIENQFAPGNFIVNSTFHPGKYAHQYVHAREVDPNQPNWEKLARDLAEALEYVDDLQDRKSCHDKVKEALARYRAALKE